MMPMCSISEAFHVLKGMKSAYMASIEGPVSCSRGDRLEADGSFKGLDL